MDKETHDMNKEAYGVAAMGRLGILEWLTLFEEVIHEDFVPPGQSVNPVSYVEVLTRLRNPIARVHPANANHNNVPSPAVFRVVEYLTQHSMATLPHPPL
ncbi:hypothetical protein TNCV_702441 [Trichonephila clavipes]|nr:hypothetical protein TNCV_702441 [Trichonephila clavipes]